METLLLILQIVVLLFAIFLGIRLGGMAIGYAGGLGVVILCLFLDMKPGNIPWDVILIIMSVIAAITAMQVAGGLDYMVQVAEKILRKNPKQINYLAPSVTYFLTLLAGTGHTAFSMIPVIVEVAKEQNIKPSAPLSVAVVSSQIAITASPVSAAVVYMSGVLDKFGWSYPTLILIWILTTYSACMITAFIVSKFFPLDLSKDVIYQERLKAGLIKQSSAATHVELKPGAKKSVVIFLIGVLCVVFYATTISDVIRKPMLDYVNSFIPPSIDTELESMRANINKNMSSDLAGKYFLPMVDSKIESLQEGFSKKVDIDDYIARIDSTKREILENLQNDTLISQEKIKEISEMIESSFANIQGNARVLIEAGIADNSFIVSIARFVKSYIDPVRLPRDGAIMSFMLGIAAFITILCRLDTSALLNTSTFKSGMTACVCVLGVAWLGNTFVEGYTDEIGAIAKEVVNQYPALLALTLFLASMLLYSQAATAKAIMPVVIGALGISAANAESSYIIVASFAAVSALFVLPTYPTLLGAVQMDYTGSTRIGKYIFNHSFILPGIIAITISVGLGFVVAPMFG